MIAHEINGLKYYTFASLDGFGIKHGIFTRKGGVSQPPLASLNLGGTVADLQENVIENRRRLFQALQLPIESLHDVWQVHGTDIQIVEKPRPLDAPHVKADGMLADIPGITLLMRFADCVPILLRS